MVSAGKIMRLHKAVAVAVGLRWDERPLEKTIQGDVLDYYDLLADTLRKIDLTEDELHYLHWLFGFKQVRREERAHLHRAVERLAATYPWQGTTKPEDFARRLIGFSTLGSLAISDAMERAVAHPSYMDGKQAMYRAVGLLPPLADDPYSRPPQPTATHEIPSTVLKTSDTWTWPRGWEQFVIVVKSLRLSKAELRTIDERLVGGDWMVSEVLFSNDPAKSDAADPFLAGVSGRMQAQYGTIAWWSSLVEAVKMARNHPEYASDPVAAYRAAGLCA